MNDAQQSKLLARYERLRLAAKAVGRRNGSCWCGVRSVVLEHKGDHHVLHTEQCDRLYLALYGAERGE